MPVKNPFAFTREGVFLYIERNRGLRYQTSQLARVFKTDTIAMQAVIEYLIAEKGLHSIVTGRYRYYFLQSDQEIKAAGRVREAPVFRELVGYEKRMREIMKGRR